MRGTAPVRRQAVTLARVSSDRHHDTTLPPVMRRKKRATRTLPPRTPEAVDGRKHIDIQTDVYLEELTDTVPEVDNTTQTDAFLDRPPTPLFVPQKTGTDAITQIESGASRPVPSARIATHVRCVLRQCMHASAHASMHALSSTSSARRLPWHLL